MDRSLAWAVAASAFVTGGLLASRVSRDGLFLTHYPASALPYVVIGSALLSLLAAAAIARWVARSGPARVVPLVLGANAAVFVAEWVALDARPRAVAAGLYLHVTALGPLLVSGFWSVVTERFDPHTLKRFVSRMTGAGALAGVAGGVAVERAASMVGIGWALGLLAALSATAALAIRWVGAPEDTREALQTESERGSLLQLLGRHTLLAPMALLMVLGAAVDAFVDFALKLEAAAAFADTAQLVRFFAAFYVSTGLLAFALQSLIGSSLLRRFGLGGAMAMLPVGVLVAGSVALVSPRLWSVTLLRGVEAVAAGGLFRSGFELLYTPVPAALARRVKAWIDVSSRAAGSLVGGGLVLFLLFVVPDLGSGVVVALAMATAIFVGVAVIRADRAYVAQLGSSLRSGSVSIHDIDAIDATTASTVAAASTVVSRQSLLQEVRTFTQRQASRKPSVEAEPASVPSAGAPVPARPTQPGAAARAAAEQALLARVTEITSGDPQRVRRALNVRPTAAAAAQDRRVAAHVIPLLGAVEVARDAEAFLRRLAPRAPGQLIDGLLDRSEERSVRLALARIVSGVAERRTLEGLWLGLDDVDFALRQACAEGAVRVVEQRRDLAPPKDAVHARIERELAASGQDAAPGDRLLEHVFALLALLHGRETMRSTLSGVGSDDPAMRGTAFELLESVLPPRLWQRVLARIQERERATGRTEG